MKQLFIISCLLMCYSISNGQVLPWIQTEDRDWIWYEELKLRYPQQFSPHESYPYSWSEYLHASPEKLSPFASIWHSWIEDRYQPKDTLAPTIHLIDHGRLIASSEPEATKSVRLTNYLRLFGSVGDHFAFSTSVWVDNDAARDPDYRGRIENKVNNKSVQGFLLHRHAYGLFNFSGLEMMVGKNKLNWSPSSSPSMILSHNGPAMDQIWFRYTWKAIRLTTFYAQLDRTIFEPFGTQLPEQTELARQISGGRLEVEVLRGLSVALSQTVITVSRQYELQLSYLNPFISFFGERENNGLPVLDDNIAYSADISFRRPGLHAYGSFFMDDYSLDGEVVDKIGIKTGLSISDPVWSIPLTSNFELIRIQPKTYSVKSNNGPVWLNYVYYAKLNGFNDTQFREGALLGHPVGPDSWKVLFKLRYLRFYPSWFEWESTYTFQGKENNIISISDTQLNYLNPSESTNSRFTIHYDQSNIFSYSVWADILSVTNPGHFKGNQVDYAIGLKLTYFFDYPFEIKTPLF